MRHKLLEMVLTDCEWILNMEKSPKKPPKVISDRFIQTVCTRLAENKQVRRTLPLGGRLHIDRQLPFLCVYRRPPGRVDTGTDRLVMGQAAYIVASGDKNLSESLSKLIRRIVETLSPEFGAFLLFELWAGLEKTTEDLPQNPEFRILTQHHGNPSRVVRTLEQTLTQIRVGKLVSRVEARQGRKIGPVGQPALLPVSECAEIGCFTIGLEVRPIYYSQETGEVFPLIRRALLQQLTRVLHQTFFEFSRTETSHRPSHFHVLGRRAVVKAVWEVDRQLAEVSNAFDFLLQVTPVNSRAAYAAFKQSGFDRTPVFHYPPQSFDVAHLKRELWGTRIERIEDPTLGQLFREKRNELDTQLTMLTRMDTPDFLYGGLQLFGPVDDKLLDLAETLLTRVPARSREKSPTSPVKAPAFANRAEAELAYYRQQMSSFSANVQIRDDMYTGLMVSQGNLIIGKGTKISTSRVEALLQHEVGTHILTYFNGRAQPFRMLYTGLAGYEEMQEGLAVLAEYLVGGLSLPRLRLLAARVLATRCLIDGASFIDTFRCLIEKYHFSQRGAFTLTMRIYRGGGFPKDAVYLRGLVGLLDYLKKGGDLMPLFVGKIATEHIPLIQELQWRKVLIPTPLRPRYMESSDITVKLERLREGMSLLDLIETH